MDYLAELHDEYSRCQEDYNRVIESMHRLMVKELRYLTYVRFGLTTVTKLQFIVADGNRCLTALDASGKTVNASNLLSTLSVEGCMLLRHFDEIAPLQAIITSELQTLKIYFEELPIVQMMLGGNIA